MSKVTIEPACLRDGSFIIANMRPLDEDEVLCQVADGMKRHEIAYFLLMTGENFVAKLDGLPVMFFGTTPLNVAALNVWALGTSLTPRCVPAVTKFMIRYLYGKHLEGWRSMEARSLVTHHTAHRWMERTGAVAHGEPFVYGKNREKFLLFRWVPECFPAVARRHRVKL